MTYRFPAPEPIRFAVFQNADLKDGTIGIRPDRVESFHELLYHPGTTTIKMADGTRYDVRGTAAQVYKELTGEKHR